MALVQTPVQSALNEVLTSMGLATDNPSWYLITPEQKAHILGQLSTLLMQRGYSITNAAELAAALERRKYTTNPRQYAPVVPGREPTSASTALIPGSRTEHAFLADTPIEQSSGKGPGGAMGEVNLGNPGDFEGLQTSILGLPLKMWLLIGGGGLALWKLCKK